MVHFRKIVIVKDDIIPLSDEKGFCILGVEKFC